jgi:hypothetical protein
MNVVTLIPAYKPKYLVDLLSALAQQTHRPQRVIVSDDSPDQAFVRVLAAPENADLTRALKLSVIAGPRRGAFLNMQNLLREWNGESELFHFLFDDDLIYPTFYERHVAAHRGQQYPCTISRRWTANENGMPVGQLAMPDVIYNHDHRLLSLESSVLFDTVLPRCYNWLGEFSNCVMRGELASSIENHTLADISFYGLIDIGVFLTASTMGPVGFLNEALGAFRTGPEQNTGALASRNMKLAHLAWFALGIAGQRVGRISAEHARQGFARMGSSVFTHYRNSPDLAEFCAALPGLIAGEPGSDQRFLDAWNAYIIEPVAALPGRTA